MYTNWLVHTHWVNMNRLKGSLNRFLVFAIVFMSFMLITPQTYALESYVLGDDVNFANSQGQGYINTEVLAGGAIKTTLNTANPSSIRMYYASSSTEQYRVDLTNFSFKFTINQMTTGASYKLAFLKSWDDFPLDQWGTGLGFLMQDDNGGAYNVLPYLYTGGVGQTNDAARNYYLVYDNATRPSHLNKTIILTSVDSGSNLLITMQYEEESGNQVKYQNEFPKSYFTDRGMDPTSVLFMFGVNSNNGQDFEFTINDITDTHTEAYNTQYGDHANSLFDQVDLIDLVDEDITANEIKTFYQLKRQVNALTNLRKADLYKKQQSENVFSTLGTAYADAVVVQKNALFGLYDEDFEVTAENLAEVQLALYIHNLNKTQLNDEVLNQAMQLLLDKTVAYASSDEIDAVETSIANYLTTYATVTAANYLTAKSDYQVVLSELNALDEQIRPFVSNGADLLAFATQLATGKDLFYTNENTYWVNYDSNLHFVRSVSSNEGTHLRLIDSYGDTRVVYGDNENEYVVSLEDFSLSFIIDSIEDVGRFAINFGQDRDMIPNQSVGKMGLSVVFRSTSASTIDVALKDTSTDTGLTFGTPLDSWGKYGSISASAIEGKLITMSFETSGTNYKLVFTVEDGTGFEVTVPSRFFSDRGLNPDELIMNITTGEGANHNGGKDIELTIVDVLGKQEDAYTAYLAALNDGLTVLEGLYSKITGETATKAEIESYNTHEAIDATQLRAHDVLGISTRLNAINSQLADEKVAKKVDDLINTLPASITEANYQSTVALIASIDELILVVTEEQHALMTKLSNLDTTKANVEAYEETLEEPETPEVPETPDDEGLTSKQVTAIVVGSTLGVVGISLGAIFIIKKFKK